MLAASNPELALTNRGQTTEWIIKKAMGDGLTLKNILIQLAFSKEEMDNEFRRLPHTVDAMVCPLLLYINQNCNITSVKNPAGGYSYLLGRLCLGSPRGMSQVGPQAF